MEYVRRALSALQRRDDSVIPAVCYASCNNAYIEAQEVDKNASLCAPDSPFAVNLASCESCIKVNTNSSNATSNIAPEFQPFIEFCESESATSLVPATTQLLQAESSLLAQASSLGLTLGSTVQITQTVFSTETITAPQPPTTSNPIPSSQPTTKPKSTNKSWIAGAVVGPVVVVAIGVLAFWIWMRKRRHRTAVANKQQPDEEKKDDIKDAELVGESKPRHELEGRATTELSNERVSELPALEPVGSELSAKKTDPVRRKPVGGGT